MAEISINYSIEQENSEAVLIRMQKDLNFYLKNLNHDNVYELNTNICNIQSSNGETIIDGPLIKMYKSGDSTLRLKMGYNSSSDDFEFALYNEAGSQTMYIDSNGDAVFAGTLSAVDGTFSGTLSGADGTFTGDLVAVGGTFSGTLSAASGTFTGTVSAGTISGSTITGGTITIGSNFSVDGSGNLEAVNADLTGSIKTGTGSTYTQINSSGIQMYGSGSLNGLVCSNGSNFLNLYDSGTVYFGIFKGSWLEMYGAAGATILEHSGTTTYPKNTWDFSDAGNVTGLETVTLTYTGSDNHDHGIAAGTSLAISGGGSVTWVPSGSHTHTVSDS